MLKNILCAGLLAASAIAAQAMPQTWSFTYTGFYEYTKQTGDIQYGKQTAYGEYEFGQWNPSLTISGGFTGEDRNRDGVLSLSELSSLKVGITDYIACADSNFYWHCGAQSFSYKMLGGILDFSAGLGGHDPEWFHEGGEGVTTGDRYYYYYSDPMTYRLRELIWTAQTTLSITSPITSPVSEPANYAMLGTGLLGLAAFQRGRRRLPGARRAAAPRS